MTEELIRKSDALAHCYDNISFAAIRALPAIVPTVRPLVWRENPDIGESGIIAWGVFGAVYHAMADGWSYHRKGLWVEAGSLEAAKAAAQADYTARILAALTPTAPPKTWPEGFFHLTGDTLHLRCATEGCGQRVSARMEVEGIGSDYCEPCILKIIALTPTPVDASQAADPLVNAPDPAAIREAALRVGDYLKRRARAHGFDQAEIHTFDAGCDSEASLLVADLELTMNALIAKGAAE